MSEQLNDELASLMAKEADIQNQVQVYQRKMMEPLWKERRELAKKIPNFWSDAAIENLEDFHVEYDEARPEYRKVVATFKKNDVFKNESLTKEFTTDEETGTVISKSTIEYHAGKEPNNKRKAGEVKEDDFDISFLKWFGDESIPTGVVLTEEIFPAAIDYYKGESEDEDDDDDIELGSDSEDEEESPQKKAKK
ncbi:unnamed protein product [Absidia cylindrospora]